MDPYRELARHIGAADTHYSKLHDSLVAAHFAALDYAQSTANNSEARRYVARARALKRAFEKIGSAMADLGAS